MQLVTCGCRALNRSAYMTYVHHAPAPGIVEPHALILQMCRLLADALPPPAQEALAQVKSVAGQAASQVSHLVASNPDVAKAAAVPLLGVPLFLTVAGRFGAYKGPLPPSKAYNILQVTGCGTGVL